MHYVISDLHGYPPESFLRLLEQAAFSAEDTLYVLGDVIDRREDGPRLLRWMMRQPNVRVLLGNHEAMMLACESFIDGTPMDAPCNLSYTKQRTFALWEQNGGVATQYGLSAMRDKEIAYMLAWLRERPLYEEIVVGERRYVLTHSGLGEFSADKPLEAYEAHELLWERPSPQTRYYDDRTVVFGHTPTLYYPQAEAGRPLVTDTWINIDVGAACGWPPLLYRLEDGAEFYGER